MLCITHSPFHVLLLCYVKMRHTGTRRSTKIELRAQTAEDGKTVQVVNKAGDPWAVPSDGNLEFHLSTVPSYPTERQVITDIGFHAVMTLLYRRRLSSMRERMKLLELLCYDLNISCDQVCTVQWFLCFVTSRQEFRKRSLSMLTIPTIHGL